MSGMGSERQAVRRRLLTYYGDDFTGSTDVLEALFRAGLHTVLFLEPPQPELLNGKFADADCFGIAGVGRSLSPDEMERELRPLFATLKSVGAAVVHYKICSTLDSSPDTGNIGKAAEIGSDVFGTTHRGYIPLLVGVPYLRRYTVFGHHFAGAGDTVHRLDRHPTMSQHPVTPMAEADLRVHLSRQTKLRTSLFDLNALNGSPEDVSRRLDELVRAEQPDMVLFDVLDERRLETAGRLIWEEAASGEGVFVIGSSGVEYALGAVWKADGLVSADVSPARSVGVGAVERLLVVSGSCSPVTELQIRRALQVGYVGIRVPVEECADPELAEGMRSRLRQEALALLAAGRSVILYSAAGPQDESIGRMLEALAAQGLRAEDSSRLLGASLGALAKELIAQAGLPRVVIAGGDTSGYVARELGIYALECRAELEPGGPLCRAYSHEPAIDGLELVLKGGQVGSETFFEHVRLGHEMGH
jgi:uncharacterized protein YgbK (DUF1537 family)